jgi:outer membrane protein assembly factor BamB
MKSFVGEQFGNFMLLSAIGSGGFADIYLGEHIHLGSHAAIKVLTTSLTDQDRKIFLDEARFLARLSHQNIVRVFDYGIHTNSGMPYLVMDYAPNGSLRKCHPAGSIVPLANVVTYVRQIANALQYAHDQKLIHRDVKPENMLIGTHNEILLSDFGIALQSTSTKSQSMQEVAGTASYMAPEQFNGHARAASDQYALGIVVYEWLCGFRPYTGSFFEVASQHMFAEPPPMRKNNSQIPPEVELVVKIALTKDPKLRFASVHSFANALQQAAFPTQRPSAPSWSGIPDQSTHVSVSPSQPSIQGTSTPVLTPQMQHTVPPGITPIPPGELPIEARLTNQSNLITPTSATNPASLLPSMDASAVTEQELASDASGAWPAHKPFPSRRSLIIAGVATLSIAGTLGGTWAWLQSGSGSTTPTVTPDKRVSSKGTMFGIDPQHTHVIPNEQTLTAATAKNLQERWHTHLGGSINLSSPLVVDNVLYVGSTNSHLHALNANDGTELWKYNTGNEILSSPACAGDYIYFGSGDNYIYAITKGGKPVWQFRTEGSVYASPVIVDGILYIGSWDRKFYAIDAITGRKVWSTPTENGMTSSPAFANNTVFFGCADKYIYALNASTGKVLWKVQTGDEIFGSPAVVNGVVYVGSKDTYFYAINAQSGKVLWQYQTYGAVQSSPAVWNDSIYVGSKDANLWAFSKNGDLLWQKTVPYEIASSPAIVNGVIYVGSWDHNIYALDISNKGHTLWQGVTTDGIDSSPTVAQGMVYIGSRAGDVYAYGL